MNDKIDEAIEALAERIDDKIDATDAMKFTQSALNLAHVRATYDAIEREARREKS